MRGVMGSESVLVVGAGPTGLAVAIAVASAGVAVRVVDMADGPAVTSRALGLQPRGVEVLDRLGGLGDLRSRCVSIQEVVVHIGGRELGRLAVGTPTRLVRHPGLLVSQAEIEGELRRRLTELGVEVEWGRAVVASTQTADAVHVRLADGEVVDACWVVGCDGAHSVVRKSAGIGFPGVRLVEQFLLADVRAELPVDRGSVAVWIDGADMVAAFPLPGRDVWRLMAPAPDGAPPVADAPDDVVARLGELLTLRSGIPKDVVRDSFWTSQFRFHRRLAVSYRSGRVLLAGDAAHIHSPFGGQGLNTGVGDAENLGWKLALVCTGRASAQLLDTYEAERRPIAQEVLASTTGFTRLVMGRSLLARLVRDHVLVPLMNRRTVQRLIWDRASQLLISYRKGPLGRSGSVRGPLPGDRVPDMTCLVDDGERARLHDQLGPRWAVVAADPALRASCAKTAARWLGPDGVVPLAPASPARRGAALVRPDGHLAWRGTDPVGAARWLTRALGPLPQSRAGTARGAVG
ncbi:FAD-dependent monooxygenase [Actinomycetes bacterium KLBMP 9759]